MADPTENLGNMDLFTFKVFWKTKTVGLIKEVDHSNLKLLDKEKKIARTGDAVLDRVIRGATGSVKTVLYQCDPDVIKTLCPWWVSGPVPLVPSAFNFSEYPASGPLLFHPDHLADTAKDHDVTFVKAFPRFTMPKAGGDWREIEVNWNIYPDQTQLLTNSTYVTHYFGAPPV